MIFQPIKIFCFYNNSIKDIYKRINKFMIKNNNNINFKIIIESYSELIKTLLNPIINYSISNFGQLDSYINNSKEELNKKKDPNNNDNYKILKEILFSYMTYTSKNEKKKEDNFNNYSLNFNNINNSFIKLITLPK